MLQYSGHTLRGALTCLLLLPDPGAAQVQHDRREEREAMVRGQIAARGVTDPATLRAMRTVPRHEFVPPSLSGSAYDDNPLPIGHGQTISQPYIVASMTETVRAAGARKVLEIGTGSGYQAAVLAEILDSVWSIEIVGALASTAAERLQRLGYRNITVRHADGYHGWPEHALFDAIVVTAAAEFVPPPLIAQLKDGGRMVIPVGPPFTVQTLMLVEKKGGKVTSTSLMAVRFVPLTRSD
jgi:protein-L-isoaspartate(D-aspartate) O-methyltransferase